MTLYSPLEACDHAADFLKKAGFTFVTASMKSTSTYYALEERIGTIRVSIHGRKKDRASYHLSGPVVSTVTFPSHGGAVAGERVEYAVASAVGIYMIRAKKRPT